MKKTAKKPKKKLKKRLIILAVLIVLNIVMNAFGNALKTEYYSLVSDRLTAPVRLVFLSDLHNCTYGGAEQSGLWEEIERAKPDLVLFGGDVIDIQGGTEHAIQLMKMVQEKYPCAYAAGNHEMLRRDKAAFFDEAAALGIPVLHGTYTDVTVRNQNIRILGVINTVNHSDQLVACCRALDADRYSILLLHEPQQLDDVVAAEQNAGNRFDLVLSGHAHGGQWQIPGILDQGLYAPDQGLLPAFTHGQRTEGGTVQIVSRGLAKPLRMLLIPRIFNRPELTVVDIAPVNP